MSNVRLSVYTVHYVMINIYTLTAEAGTLLSLIGCGCFVSGDLSEPEQRNKPTVKPLYFTALKLCNFTQNLFLTFVFQISQTVQ